MTLAAIFLLGFFFTPSANSMPGAELRPDVSLQNTQNSQSQSAPAQNQEENKQNAAAAPAKAQAGQTTATKPHRRKKKTTSDCGTLPAPNSTAVKAAPAKKSPTATPDAATSAGTKVANCPPEKIVVRHGGSTDPSIQLAGGATGGQATREKATANQMLASTEENLKKLETRQLSSSEQATVTQIRQYVEQSKTAITSNDLERARTLAWKAQTLSDDLANPKQ